MRRFAKALGRALDALPRVLALALVGTVAALYAATAAHAGPVSIGAFPGLLAQALLVGGGPTTAPSDGQVLTYQASTKRLVYATPSGGGVTGITDGSGTANRLAYWTDSDSIGSSAGFRDSSGHLIAVTDNTYDIGASGATRPRRVYVGTEVVTPLATVAGNIAQTTSASLSGAGTVVAEGYKRRVYTYTGGAGSATTLTESQSGAVILNTGATAETYQTLPTLTTASQIGVVYTLVIDDADGARFTAGASDTITLSSVTGAGAGNVRSTTVGSSITLVAISTSQWVAISATGVWQVN